MKTIPLPSGKVALVDDADYDAVSQHSWHSIAGRKYAATRINKRVVYLHRFLTNARENEEVDHINGDGLDCRRANMRVCAHRQNQQNQGLSRANTSGFKGVVRVPSGRWVAQIKVRPKCFGLGTFDTPEEAARAYDTRAVQLWGEFARTNQRLGLLHA